MIITDTDDLSKCVGSLLCMALNEVAGVTITVEKLMDISKSIKTDMENEPKFLQKIVNKYDKILEINGDNPQAEIIFSKNPKEL